MAEQTESKKAMGDVAPNGKVILLYNADAEPHFEGSAKQILIDCGIIPIACNNPNNFRFVVPEVVAATHVDLIGRLALQCLGSDKPVTAFGNAVRHALAPIAPNTTVTKKPA